jgi:hypothetical protein
MSKLSRSLLALLAALALGGGLIAAADAAGYVGALSLGAAGDSTVGTLDQWKATTSPTAAITQRVDSRGIRLTGFSSGCLELDASGNLASTGGSCGSGGGDGWATTSADYWKTQRSFYSTTSADHWLTTKSTSNLAEGANLYYTPGRVNDLIGASTTIPHPGGLDYGEVLVFDGARWTAVATTTLNIVGAADGSWSTTSADHYVAASTTIAHPGNAAYGNLIGWDGARWNPFATSSLKILSSDVLEGSNLFYTLDRWAAALAGTTTDALAEGLARLYYTNERVDDEVDALLQDGTGISFSYNDGANTLTPTVTLAPFTTANLAENTNLYFTDERAQDAVGGMVDTTLVYTDGTPLLSRAALTGDVAASAGSNSTTIQDNSVDGTDIAFGSDAAGDVAYYDGANWVRLPIGTAGQVLEVNAGATAPEWDTDGGLSNWGFLDATTIAPTTTNAGIGAKADFFTATSTTATSTFPKLSVTSAFNLLGEYMTDAVVWVRAKIDGYLTGGDGIDYASGAIAFNCTEVEGTGINCSTNDITLDATGDWTGTVDGNNFGGGAIGQGDILYGSAAGTLSELAKDANATRYLSNTGASNNPAWAQVDLSNGITGTLPFGNGGTGATAYGASRVPYVNAGNTALTSSGLLVFDGTRLGVGTSSPSSKLAVHAIHADALESLFSVATSSLTATSTVFNIGRTGDVTLAAGVTVASANTAAGWLLDSINSLAADSSGVMGFTTRLTTNNAEAYRYTTRNAAGDSLEAMKIWNGTSGSQGPRVSLGATTSPMAMLTLHAYGNNFQPNLLTIATSTLTSTTTVLNISRLGDINAGDALSLEVPNGTGNTLANNGEIAVDTTNGQLLYYANGSARALTATTTKSITIESPASGDDFLWFRAPYNLTVRQVNCIVDPAGSGESVVVTINENDGNGDSPAGIDGATTITCANTNTQDDAALSNASIDAGDWVSIDPGTVTGTVTQLSVTLTYTADRE